MLNQLLGSLGSGALASLAGSGALAGLMGRLGGGQPASVSTDQAAQVTPEQVQQIASHAEQHDPGIVDKMSGFYAEHPTLVKTLGGAALSIALAKIAEKMKS